MRKWWDELNRMGPKYGYFPKPSKTILIVKNPALLDHAKEMFAGSGINIDVEGERHLGAVIGSEEFKEQFVNKKVEKWIKDVEQLSFIAKDEPQLVLSAFTKALNHRWCFMQRTIPNISTLFQPLEDTIREKLIPAIVGRRVSDIERKILSLPVRLGGIGIQNPTETADVEYDTSVKITENLKTLIYNQERTLENLDEDGNRRKLNMLKEAKEKRLMQQFEEIKSQVDENMKQCLGYAREKGSGAWLSALPIQAIGYVLNKQEFRDGLCLRYGWKIPNTPYLCACGEKNDVNHALICKSGGYVSMRHNKIRDVEASILRDVCKDVKIEPELMPIGNMPVDSSNTSEKARLDVSAVGIWSPMERTLLDIRVMHPNSPSYRGKELSKIYEIHEKEKKRSYNQRVLQIEKASFTPLVFSTSGGMAPECTRYHRRIAELISSKTKEDYSKVMDHIRTRIRFTLLKSTLMAIRGERGKSRKNNINVSELSFNIVPDIPSYEV